MYRPATVFKQSRSIKYDMRLFLLVYLAAVRNCLTRTAAVSEIADRTALEIWGLK